MNLQLLVKRILADEDTLVRPGKIVSQVEIDQDKYLKSAFYFNNDSIRVVTARHLIVDSLGGKDFPRVQRGVDITQYAYDFILKEGRSLIFIQDGLDYSILRSLKDKRFMSFGENRQIPFGVANFLNPRENALSITEPYTYGKPIMIVEGLRDCLDAQTIYPYTLAMQTAAIPKMVQEVLSTLTDTLILAFDNDEAGQRATHKAGYLNFDLKYIQLPEDIKDLGSLSELYLVDSFKYEWLKSYLISQLQIFI